MFREYRIKCDECGLESTSSRTIESEGAVNADGLQCQHERHYNLAGAGAPRGNVRIVSFEDKRLDVSDVLPYVGPTSSRNSVLKRKDSESESSFGLRAYLNNAYGHIGPRAA